MEADFEKDMVFTGGRDGSVFLTMLNGSVDNILRSEATYDKLFQSNPKQMITCLKVDDVNNKLWYGTPNSVVNCLDLVSKSSA